MNIDLTNLVGKFAEYRRDSAWDTKVTIQGCFYPTEHLSPMPQLIATAEDGSFIVDTIKRFRVK